MSQATEQPNAQRVGIVGGGIMGVTLGYELARQGRQVDIYEASPVVGGLAGPYILPDGNVVDRFYHAILSSDRWLHTLCRDLGILDRLRFRQTKMGFFHQNAIYPMNSLLDFLRFPPLNWIDRFRLGLTILAAQRVSDWRQLESIDIETWLTRWGGANAYRNLWRPMLRAKFDGNFAQVPATWIWSRLVRMKSTRQGAAQKEQAGHLIGGYQTLLNAMAAAIRATGGALHVNAPVQEIVVDQDRVAGIRCRDQLHPYTTVVCTLQTPLLSRLIPGADAAYRARLQQQEYLGVLCMLLVLERPLTGYWTLNITDETIPFTGIIETTSYIDPVYVGGHHLVYLPKYTLPDSDWQRKSDAEIEQIWLDALARMFPAFDRRTVRYCLVQRERYVEPLHRIGAGDVTPTTTTPIAGLWHATTAQIYPALTNGESVARHAHTVAHRITVGPSPTAIPEQEELCKEPELALHL